jgi:uncharacterized membrane protein (DUF441 family)
MRDQEIVKLKYWLDAELMMLRVWLAMILAFVAHNKLITIALCVYIVLALIYAGIRLAYVEKLQADYLKTPKE